MQPKSINLLTMNIDEDNPKTKFIMKNLKDWKIQSRHVKSVDILIITNEIEASVKCYDISILFTKYSGEVAHSLSLVFHQDLQNVTFGPIPKHARFLDKPNNTVLYIQGLIVIPTSCDLHTTFPSVVKLFINNTAVLNGDICNKLNVYTFSCYDHVNQSIENIEKCLSLYPPETCFISFNGGKDCTVLLHMILAVLKRNYPKYSNKLLCLYVEESNAFSEINDFVEECKNNYTLNIVKINKNIKESLVDILHSKPHLKTCLMGTRRTDPFSQNLKTFQMTDSDWPQVMRVSPLLDWHYSEIWDYLLTLNVPYCKLYDMGYTSLGNVNNTKKNPSLLFNDGYLPAYKLLDASQERQGRFNKLKS